MSRHLIHVPALLLVATLLPMSPLANAQHSPSQVDRAVIDVHVGVANPASGDASANKLKAPSSIRRAATQPAVERAAIPPRSNSLPSLDLLRVVWSFAIVLALIFGLRYIARRFFNLPSLSAAAGPIQVLHRTPIAPRQQLMLIQVGRRLLLVANAGAQMNTLCEITDPDEIAALALPAPAKTVPANPFAAWFGRANASFESAPPMASTPDDAPKDPVTRDDVNALLEKVRGLSRSFRQT